MRTSTALKLIAALVLASFVCLSASSVFGHQQDSSQKSDDAVAEAARKAREKKKDTTKAKKVYTNEDMGGLPAGSVSTVGQAQGAPDAEKPGEGAEGQNAKPKDQANAAGAGPDAGKDQEQVWRKRFKDAYAKLAQTEKELDILQREDNKAQLQYYSDPQKAMTEGYSRKEINDKQAKIAAKQKEIADQKAHIDDMQDDLRKAGGDPGWASPQ